MHQPIKFQLTAHRLGLPHEKARNPTINMASNMTTNRRQQMISVQLRSLIGPLNEGSNDRFFPYFPPSPSPSPPAPPGWLSSIADVFLLPQQPMVLSVCPYVCSYVSPYVCPCACFNDPSWLYWWCYEVRLQRVLKEIECE